MGFPYLEAVVGFMIVLYFFETYLDLRQHAALKLPKLPKTLEGVISQEKFEKSRSYSLDKSYFHFVHEAVTILMEASILSFAVLPLFWKKAGDFLVYAGLNAENEIIHTLAFLGVLMIWSQITDLPFSLYSTFVIEEFTWFQQSAYCCFGLSDAGAVNQTVWLFFRDMIKGILLSIVIGPPIIAALIVIMQKGGPYLAIYLWAFTFVLSIVMMTVYPILIAPLFNKFTPLPEGELRQKIENLASSLKFPLKKLFVVDGSTRSSHSNAYMYGFFNNKRIVLYDTLIQQSVYQYHCLMSLVPAIELVNFEFQHVIKQGREYVATLNIKCKDEEEVVAVIAHELGHWKLRHTMYQFVAVQHIVTPIQHLVSFCLNLVSRAFEFQADAFAKKLGYGKPLRAGLVKLQEENLSAMNTDPWYSAYHYSHPPLVERLAAIDESDKKTD
ncbi:hypothetical protein IFM89_026546 [Coptis chinensis]|uniref:CAAX prenyl protease n=1 Tax=Coptis chinensis TaxID=261450 RepID=A0A835HMG9_9MAGN|nr:hypothetical protein IFM89_026546 [Coptis chinensis]